MNEGRVTVTASAADLYERGSRRGPLRNEEWTVDLNKSIAISLKRIADAVSGRELK